MGLTAAESNGRSQDTEALYREHGAAVARLCGSLLRDRAEAEDATQQVFLSAHRALLNGGAPREPLAWLLAVARNECYSRFRQRAVVPVPSAETPDAAAADASVQALRAGELATVWDEVGQMPPAQREAFLLREIRGLSYDQLADELSLSRPSVRSLLLRARTRLRLRLGDMVAGLGGAPWVQALLRLGGDGASPVPAVAKVAAVGVGALALAGGGSLVARHPSRNAAHAGARHRGLAHPRREAVPPAIPVAPSVADVHSSSLERSSSHDMGTRDSGSGRSGSRDGGGEISASSGSTSSGSGDDGSNGSTAVAQPTTDGHDGGGSSSSGPGSGSTSISSSGSGRDGSGSDGGSGSTTTTTTTTTSGSDGSGGPGGGTSTDGGGTDGGVTGTGTDGGVTGGGG